MGTVSLPLSRPNADAHTTSYGPDDQLGTLNRLTPSIVKAASSEIQSGVRIGLDWPLDAQKDLPFFSRREFHQQIKHKAPRCVNDDEWTFNTQSSTQCTHKPL